jgi:hypothetical protein
MELRLVIGVRGDTVVAVLLALTGAIRASIVPLGDVGRLCVCTRIFDS